MKCNKNLREHRKNRNCLKNWKVVMKYKVSGAIAIPKASWGCAPALPNWMQLVFLRRTCSLGKRSFASGKRGFHPCFCLPACCNCPVALFEFATCFIKIINCELASFKKCNCSRKNNSQKQICSANVGYSPTPRQHFWKTAAPKNFLVCAAFIRKSCH